MRTALSKLPYVSTIDEASNGQEALDMVQMQQQLPGTNGYDVILLDLDMPILNGFDSC